MKKAIATLAAAIACIAGTAQSTEDIREDYAAAKEHIRLMDDPEYPPTNRYQVVLEKMLCGSGQHKETVTMYFYEDEENEVDICGKRSIYFATVSYNFAIRDYYEEYLYDKDGNVKFIYVKDINSDDWSEVEYRFYLDKKGVIKTTVKRKKQGEENFTLEYDGKTGGYSKALATYKGKASAYRNLFKAIDSSALY